MGRARITFSKAQRAAITLYNENRPAHKEKVNNHYCAARAQWLNNTIFGPAGVDLVPLPSPKKLQKSQLDARRNSSQPTGSTLSMSGRKSGSAAARGFTFNVSMTSDDFADPIKDIIAEQLEDLTGEFFTKADGKQLMKQIDSRLLSYEQSITRSIASLLVSCNLSPFTYHHSLITIHLSPFH